jgi:hypothetical protein
MAGFFKTREYRELHDIIDRLKIINTEKNYNFYIEKRHRCIQICGAEFGNIGFDKEAGRYRWDADEQQFATPMIKVHSEILNDTIYIFKDGSGFMIKNPTGGFILYNDKEADRIIEMMNSEKIKDKKKFIQGLHSTKLIFEGEIL